MPISVYQQLYMRRRLFYFKNICFNNGLIGLSYCCKVYNKSSAVVYLAIYVKIKIIFDGLKPINREVKIQLTNNLTLYLKSFSCETYGISFDVIFVLPIIPSIIGVAPLF